MQGWLALLERASTEMRTPMGEVAGVATRTA